MRHDTNQTTRNVPETNTTPSTEEMDMILADLRESGRSCAQDRALRLARQALAARIEAHKEAQRTMNEIRKRKTATRRQKRCEAEARARFWAARL